MRKLLPTLGVMLAFTLACGGGDDATTTDAPVVTVEPQKPAEPVKPAEPAQPAEPEKPAEPETKVVTETITDSVSVEAARKGQIEALGRRQIVAKGKSMGYSKVTNIKVGDPTCSAQTCTATVTGSVSKTVKVEDEAEGGEEPAAE